MCTIPRTSLGDVKTAITPENGEDKQGAIRLGGHCASFSLPSDGFGAGDLVKTAAGTMILFQILKRSHGCQEAKQTFPAIVQVSVMMFSRTASLIRSSKKLFSCLTLRCANGFTR